MSKPTIQRTGYEMTIIKPEKEEGHFAVQMIVAVAGEYEHRSDALLMVIDAWADAMVAEGFDPDKSFMAFRNHGRLQ